MAEGAASRPAQSTSGGFAFVSRSYIHFFSEVSSKWSLPKQKRAWYFEATNHFTFCYTVLRFDAHAHTFALLFFRMGLPLLSSLPHHFFLLENHKHHIGIHLQNRGARLGTRRADKNSGGSASSSTYNLDFESEISGNVRIFHDTFDNSFPGLFDKEDLQSEPTLKK